MSKPSLDPDLDNELEKKRDILLNNQRRLNTDWVLDENKELLQYFLV